MTRTALAALFILIVISPLWGGQALAQGGGVTHTVDCSSDTIAGAMSASQPGDTIMISGTCNEAVVVNKDGITLDGSGSISDAVIDGGDVDTVAITVLGHRNVTIKGLTVQNGLHGIRLAGGASVFLEGTIVATGNARHGILVEQNSHASIRGLLRANGNDGNGIDVSLSSSLQIRPADGTSATVQANDNKVHGIFVHSGSSAGFGGGADIEASDNGDSGLYVTESSSVAISATSNSQGFAGRFNSNNGLAGIAVYFGSSLTAWDDGFTVDITATHNAGGVGHGLFAFMGGAVYFGSPDGDPTSRVDFSNNKIGIGIYNSSITSELHAEISNNAHDGIQTVRGVVQIGSFSEAETTIAGNGTFGISVWDDADVSLRNTVITGNGDADVILGADTSLSQHNSQIDTSECDFRARGCPGDQQP